MVRPVGETKKGARKINDAAPHDKLLSPHVSREIDFKQTIMLTLAASMGSAIMSKLAVYGDLNAWDILILLLADKRLCNPSGFAFLKSGPAVHQPTLSPMR